MCWTIQCSHCAYKWSSRDGDGQIWDLRGSQLHLLPTPSSSPVSKALVFTFSLPGNEQWHTGSPILLFTERHSKSKYLTMRRGEWYKGPIKVYIHKVYGKPSLIKFIIPFADTKTEIIQVLKSWFIRALWNLLFHL